MRVLMSLGHKDFTIVTGHSFFLALNARWGIFNASMLFNEHGHPHFLFQNLKGLGHAILGNFSTDQMVIELTKIWK